MVVDAESSANPQNGAVIQHSRAVRGRNGGFVYRAEGFAAVVAYSEADSQSLCLIFCRNGVYVIKAFLRLRHIFSLKFQRVVEACGNKSALAKNCKTYVAVIKHGVKNGYRL